MNGSFLLDTSVIIGLLRLEAKVLERLAAAGRPYVSTIALGELCFGALLSRQPQETLAAIELLAADYPLLTPDASTALHYGRIKAALRQRGKPIPENDVWIAALAAQHGLTLASRDAHFNEISDLSIEVW